MEPPHFIGTLYLGIDFFQLELPERCWPRGRGAVWGLPFKNKLQSSPPLTPSTPQHCSSARGSSITSQGSRGWKEECVN